MHFEVDLENMDRLSSRQDDPDVNNGSLRDDKWQGRNECL
jgi:hypothetical protein